MRDYPPEAIERSVDDALEWLMDNQDGFPRSREQEDRHTVRRGYEMYDDFCAPPILGYEELERRGLVERKEIVHRDGEERVRFSFLAS